MSCYSKEPWYTIENEIKNSVNWHDYRVSTVPHYIEDTTNVEFHKSPKNKRKPTVFKKDYHTEQRALYVPVDPHGVSQKRLTNPKRAIFDTGAMSVCVKEGIAKEFEWQKTGETVVSGAVGSSKADIYVGGLTLTFDEGEQLNLYGVPMIEAPLPGDVDFLLGQPIIKRFVFTVNNFSSLEISM